MTKYLPRYCDITIFKDLPLFDADFFARIEKRVGGAKHVLVHDEDSYGTYYIYTVNEQHERNYVFSLHIRDQEIYVQDSNCWNLGRVNAEKGKMVEVVLNEIDYNTKIVLQRQTERSVEEIKALGNELRRRIRTDYWITGIMTDDGRSSAWMKPMGVNYRFCLQLIKDGYIPITDAWAFISLRTCYYVYFAVEDTPRFVLVVEGEQVLVRGANAPHLFELAKMYAWSKK